MRQLQKYPSRRQGHTNEFKAPQATVKMATESPEDGGANIEGSWKQAHRQVAECRLHSEHTEKPEKPWMNRPTHMYRAST